jgi:hypothetical protein
MQGTLRDVLDTGMLVRGSSSRCMQPGLALSLAQDIAAALLHLHAEGARLLPDCLLCMLLMCEIASLLCTMQQVAVVQTCKFSAATSLPEAMLMRNEHAISCGCAAIVLACSCLQVLWHIQGSLLSLCNLLLSAAICRCGAW